MTTSKRNPLKQVVLTALISGSAITASQNLFAGNPIVSHIYTADPSAHVFNDTLYVYPSHDQDNANWYNMVDYHVLSTVDCNTWTDHGVALHVDDVPWASEYMWAPDCAYKDGTYYFYFPARNLEGEFQIGVATSDSPTGPFIPEDEPIEGSFSMDPAVFIDDDGQAYMIFGGQGHGGTENAWGVKLDSTMKQFDGEPQAIEGLTYWFEGSWVHKHNGLYYMSYSAGDNYPTGSTSPILYATSTNALGPYTYQGLIGEPTSGWTDHNSIVEYNNQWYFFHQSSDLSGGASAKRCVEAEYLHYNNDGTIRPIVRTERGIGSYDGLAVIEAENYSNHSGLVKEECSDGGFDMGSIDNGDWIEFKNVEFETAFVDSFTANVASGLNGGTIEVRVGSVDGELIGSCAVPNTGGWQEWVEVSCDITRQSGTQDIYLTFVGDGTDLFNLNKFSFGIEAELWVDADEIALDLMAPQTLTTGQVEMVYATDTNIDVAVSITDESHSGAFGLMNTTPMTLTDRSSSNMVLQFSFDNTVAGLLGGESATGLVTIAWGISGTADRIEMVLPIRAELKVVDPSPILWDFGLSSSGYNTLSTVADFVAAGVSENISGASVSNVEGAQSMVSGDVTVDVSTYGGTYTPSGTYTGSGASILKEYIWHKGSSEVTIGGLKSRLYAETEYYLYVWGKGDASDQTAAFSFGGTSITTSTNDVFSSDATNFMAKFSFTTDEPVADSLTIQWDRNAEYTACGGFAIVPAVDTPWEGEVTVEELGSSPAAVNPLDLTAEGSADWVMLGQGGSTSNRDEKAGADYIGEVTVTGTHDAYTNNAYQSSWTDGSSTAAASEVQGSWEVKPPAVGGEQSLSFSVSGLMPGEYTMKMYCSRYKATGRLTVSNGTASYSEYFNADGSDVYSRYGVFTITFSVSSESESLLVSLGVDELGHAAYGNVGLTAVTLENTRLADPEVSALSIDMISDGTEVLLSWSTTYGASYGIMECGSLTGRWDHIITDVAGTGAEVAVTSRVSASSGFYRTFLQE